MTADKKYSRLDDALKDTLEQGETVKWKGEPAKISLLAAPQGTMIILRWAICFVCLMFILWFVLIYNSDLIATTNVRVFLIIFILALAYVAVRPIIDVNTIERSAVFCITNKRAIICLVTSQVKLKSASYEGISEFDIDIISNNCGNVYIGRSTIESFRKSRADTLTFNSEPIARPLVFYNVEDPDKVVTYFR